MFAQNTRVPAWKRLGLKLKGPADSGNAPAPESAPAAAAHQQPNSPSHATARVNGGAAHLNASSKRKFPPTPVRDNTANKKFRGGDDDHPRNANYSPLGTARTPSAPGLKRQKSVTFAEGTKDETNTPTAEATPARKENGEKKKKKAKKPKKKEAKAATSSASDSTPTSSTNPDFDLGPALAYLWHWHTARDSGWKFNKNHQTLLIKYVFDGDKIPSADVPAFCAYIRDLKGFVRTRLRETAQEIRDKDMEQGGEAFGKDTEGRETKQEVYEGVIARFLREQRELAEARARQEGQGKDGPAKKTNKRTFDEVEFVLRSAANADPDVKRRVLKRIRAELVLDELSDSGETSTSTETTTTSTSSASSGREEDSEAADPMDLDEDKKAESQPAPAGPVQPQAKTKRTRLRKLRTAEPVPGPAVVQDKSNSEKEPDAEEENEEDEDEDEETSGSDESSSSEEESDEEMDQAPGQEEAESSSSSSSSSESDEDADEESGDDSGDGEDEADED